MEVGGSPITTEDGNEELGEDGGKGGAKSISGVARAMVLGGGGRGGCGSRGRWSFL